MNEHQQVHLDRPTQRPDLLREEVTGPEGAGVSREEFAPLASASPGGRINSSGPQDVADRRYGGGIEPETAQFPLDAGVAPAGFPRHFNNEPAQLGLRAWPLVANHVGTCNVTTLPHSLSPSFTSLVRARLTANC